MGALGFAMDALASFTGMIVPGVSQKQASPFILHDQKLCVSHPAKQALKEFTTGMAMLQKHSPSLSTNAAHIAQQNLRLLNKNLKSCREYRQFLQMIKSSSVDTNTWGWVPFEESPEITAGFLYMQPGSSVSPNARGTRITLHEDHLLESFDNPESISKENSYYHLYLSHFGKVSVAADIFPEKIKSKLSKLNPSNLENRTTLLSPGDAYVEEFKTSRVKRLYCSGEPCLLLSVHLRQNI